MERSPIALSQRRSTKAHGFTAVELMVVIAIAAILATLAMPSFDQMIKRWQMRQDLNSVIDTIYFARSEAVKWGGNIKVTGYQTADCTASDWSCGWQVDFVDAPNPLPSGVTSPLKVVEANGKNKVKLTGGSTLTLNRWGNPNAGASVNVEHKRDTSVTQCVRLSSGGRVTTTDTSCS